MKLKIIVPLLLLVLTVTANAQQLVPVTSDKVAGLMKTEKNVVVLDVRTPMEFAQGHLKGAVNIDANGHDALAQINKLDKKAVYLVYCRTQNRSGYVVRSMAQNGFTKVYQMTDGIVGWNANNLPLVK